MVPPCRSPRYVSSALEAEWYSGGSLVDRICETTMKQSELNRDGWLAYAEAVSGRNGTRAPRPGFEQRSISTLRCNDGRMIYLEPLTGMARHPCARVNCHMRLPSTWKRCCGNGHGKQPGVPLSDITRKCRVTIPHPERGLLIGCSPCVRSHDH